MRILKLKLFLICMICFLVISNKYVVAADDDNISAIKNSLIRWLCSGIYWEMMDRPNSVLKIKIIVNNKTFRIWIQDFVVNEKLHIAGFFVGRIKNDSVAIFQHETYNINLESPLPGYIKNKPLFDNKDIYEETLILPLDCTPHYDPPTPKKELMLKTIVSTIQKQLSYWVRQGIAKYPKEVTLIIADFNIDYPSTYVMVKETKDVFSVTLHDPNNYDSDEYEKSGEYPSGEVYNKSKELIKKIRKHGITKKITLDP